MIDWRVLVTFDDVIRTALGVLFFVPIVPLSSTTLPVLTMAVVVMVTFKFKTFDDM